MTPAPQRMKKRPKAKTKNPPKTVSAVQNAPADNATTEPEPKVDTLPYSVEVIALATVSTAEGTEAVEVEQGDGAAIEEEGTTSHQSRMKTPQSRMHDQSKRKTPKTRTTFPCRGKSVQGKRIRFLTAANSIATIL